MITIITVINVNGRLELEYDENNDDDQDHHGGLVESIKKMNRKIGNYLL
jgi:hypothetical protein